MMSWRRAADYCPRCRSLQQSSLYLHIQDDEIVLSFISPVIGINVPAWAVTEDA